MTNNPLITLSKTGDGSLPETRNRENEEVGKMDVINTDEIDNRDNTDTSLDKMNGFIDTASEESTQDRVASIKESYENEPNDLDTNDLIKEKSKLIRENDTDTIITKQKITLNDVEKKHGKINIIENLDNVKDSHNFISKTGHNHEKIYVRNVNLKSYNSSEEKDKDGIENPYFIETLFSLIHEKIESRLSLEVGVIDFVIIKNSNIKSHHSLRDYLPREFTVLLFPDYANFAKTLVTYAANFFFMLISSFCKGVCRLFLRRRLFIFKNMLFDMYLILTYQLYSFWINICWTHHSMF